VQVREEIPDEAKGDDFDDARDVSSSPSVVLSME
jgi:hypothetical protein